MGIGISRHVPILSIALLHNLIFLFDNHPEFGGDAVPIQHIDTEWQIGFLKSHSEPVDAFPPGFPCVHHRQIQVGMTFCRSGNPRSKDADLTSRRISGKKIPDDCKMIGANIDHVIFSFSMRSKCCTSGRNSFAASNTSRAFMGSYASLV